MNTTDYDLHATQNGIRIHLKGQFNFHARKAFNQASQKALHHADGREIALDMADIDYMDSAALGMLLLLRDKAGKYGKQIVLKRAQGQVLEILQVANFDRLFDIA